MTAPSIVRQLHASLASHAPDQLITVLQEAGYAAGEGLFKAFSAVNSPTDLDADLLADTLSEFFTSGGWGTVTLSPVPPIVMPSFPERTEMPAYTPGGAVTVTDLLMLKPP